MPDGDTGEVPLGVCEDEAPVEMPSTSSGTSDPFRDRAPIKLFFNLNFSIQLELNT